jgi:AraC-like DNA-binding protein
MRELSIPVSTMMPVDCLQSDIERICGSFQIESHGRASHVRGKASMGRIGRFEAAYVSIDADRVTRDRKQIAQDPGDHLFLLMQEYGSCGVRQGDKLDILHPGDMYLVDSTQSSDFYYNGALSHQISLHLPRKEMMHRYGERIAGGMAIDRKDPLWLAMQAVLAKLMSGPDLPAAGAHAEAFLGLLGAYIMGAQESQNVKQSAPNAILSTALQHIEHCFRDPDFGPKDLAEKLNVSPRTLQRHFQQLDETPGKRLLNVRLDHAHAKLSGQANGSKDQSVSTIAYHCGFNDLSHFYREFRKRYGKAPGALIKGN